MRSIHQPYFWNNCTTGGGIWGQKLLDELALLATQDSVDSRDFAGVEGGIVANFWKANQIISLRGLIDTQARNSLALY